MALLHRFGKRAADALDSKATRTLLAAVLVISLMGQSYPLNSAVAASETPAQTAVADNEAGAGLPDSTTTALIEGEASALQFATVLDGQESPTQAPSAQREVKGLSVQGEWSEEDQAVTWTVKLGQDSQDVDASGLGLELTLSEGQMVESVKLAGEDDQQVDLAGMLAAADSRAAAQAGSLALADFEDTFVLFCEGASPYTLTVVTTPSEEEIAKAQDDGLAQATLDARAFVCENAANVAFTDADESDDKASVEFSVATVEEGQGEGEDAIDEATAAPLSLLSAASGPVDWTNSTIQLGLGVGSLTYKGTDNKQHNVPSTGAEHNIKYDLSTIPLSSIDSLDMSLMFTVNKDDETRAIKGGDFFQVKIPDVLKVNDTEAAQDIFAPNGNKLGSYTIKGNAVKFVFDDSVDIERGNISIVGDLELAFRLDAEALKDSQNANPSVQFQPDGTTYTFHLPGNPTTLDGMTKSGAFDSSSTSDSLINWTIGVGTADASKGLSLAGVTVTEKFDSAKQEYVAAHLGDANGPAIDFAKQADGSYAYTFPEDSIATAPATMTVVTRPAASVLAQVAKTGTDAILSNSVSMTPGANTSITPGDNASAEGDATVPHPSIAKAGTPVNADTIHYEIELAPGAIKNAVITDAFKTDASGNSASLLAGTKVYVDGVGLELNGAPGADNTYVTYENNVLKVHLKGDGGIITNGAKISFDAHINVVDTSKDASLNFPNDATLTGEYPWGGTGPGPGIDWTMPKITTDFQVAYIKKETTGVNTQTGVINWTLTPSTRTDNFTGWTITDVIGARKSADGTFTLGTYAPEGADPVVDQTYVEGSLKVYDGDEDITGSCSVKVSSTDAYGITTQQVVVTPDAAHLSHLNSLHVELQTQAVNFKYENSVDHTYYNATELDVAKVVGEQDTHFIATDDANRAFKNDFLAKTSDYQVVDSSGSSTGYVHYRLVANANEMPNKGVNLADDLNSITAQVVGTPVSADKAVTLSAADFSIGTGDKAIRVTKVSGETKTDVTATFGTKAWADDKIVNAYFPEGSDSYVVDIYLSLSQDKLQALQAAYNGNFKIDLANNATATCKEFNDGLGTTVECTGSHDGDNVKNQNVSKSAKQQENGTLAYRVEVNPNGTPMTGAVLSDTPDSSLDIDLASVTLHYAKHSVDGSIDHAVLGDEVGANDWTKQLAYDAEARGIVLKVGLPDSSASFVLVYNATVTAAIPGGKVSNSVSLKVGNDSWGTDTYEASVDSNSWGWMTTAAIYKIVKADEFGGKSMPLAGVVFHLYKDSACTSLVKTGVTNEQGIVAFYGLTPDATYYYKEDAAPSGYKLLEGDAETGEFKAGNAGSNIVQDNAYANKRLTSSAEVSLSKSYELTEGSDTAIETTPQSTFQLTLYPKGYNGGMKTTIEVTGDNGNYAYASKGTVGAKTDLINSTSTDSETSGTINISGLPWGDYELTETTAADGYSLAAAKRFSVKYDDKAAEGSRWSVVYGDEGSNVISNVKTATTITKKVNGVVNAADSAGAELSIMDSSGADVVKSPFTDAEYIFTCTDKVNSFDVSGLPAGNYILRETKGPTTSTIAMAKDVKFTMGTNGQVTVANNTVTINDATAKVDIVKHDQFNYAPATSATIQLQKWNGEAYVNDGAAQATDRDGNLSFTVDRDAKYKLVETETGTPAGYLTCNAVEFEVDEYGAVKTDSVKLNNPTGLTDADYMNNVSGNTITLRDERIMGAAQFTKKDTTASADSNKTLEGVTFSLFKVSTEAGADDSLIASGITSNKDGVVSTLNCTNFTNSETGMALSNGLTPGDYYFVETATRGDFVLPTGDEAKTDTFTVNADGSNRYSWDTPKTVLSVTGKATANVDLNACVSFAKTTADGSTALAGAVFGLYDSTGKLIDSTESATKVKTIQYKDSNDNLHDHQLAIGEVFFASVSKGSYTIKEITPAHGYKLSTAELTVTVTDSNKDQVITPSAASVANEQNSFTITKKQADGTTDLAGAEFTLTGTFAGGLTKQIITDTNKTLTGLLIAGNTYQVEETKIPVGYTKAANFSVTMRADGTIDGTNTFKNVSDTQNSVTFKKIGANNAELANVSFTVTPEKDKTFADGTVAPITIKSGDVLTGVLVAGTAYTFHEVAAPADYIAMDDFTVTVNDAGAVTASGDGVAVDGTTVTAINKAITNTVQITKLDATSGGVLAGEATTFSITGGPDGFDARTITTNKSGVASTTNLPKGAYTIAETGTDASYVNGGFKATFTVNDACDDETLFINSDNLGDATPFKLAVTDDDAHLNASGLTNVRKPGSVTLAKQDAKGAPLAGVTFELHKSDGTLVGKSKQTGSDGMLSFDNLDWGGYYLVETATLAGYQVDSTHRAFTIGYGALTAAFTGNDAVSNSQNSFTINKTGMDGAVLAGAEFTLTGAFADGSPSKVLDGSGSALTGQMVAGATYQVEETAIPAGYTKAPNFNVIMGANGKISLEQAVEGVAVDASGTSVTVADAQNTVTIAKVDGNGDALAGVTFTATAPEGKAFADGSTSKTILNGAASQALAGQLVAGVTYTFEETTCPAGYVTMGDFAVTIDEAGKVSVRGTGVSVSGTTVTATNKAITNTVSITKLDATSGDALTAGKTTFSLTGGSDGFAARTLTTNENGVASTSDLPKGSYAIAETGTDGNYVNGGFSATFDVTDACDGKALVINGSNLGDATPFNLVVNADETHLTAAGLANARVLGSVTLSKLGANKAALAGVTFELHKKSDDSLIQTAKQTADDGTLSFGELAWGDYYLVETATVAGYQVDSTHHEFTIGYGALSKSFADGSAITNSHNAFSLAKVDAGGAALGGATFTVTGKFADGAASKTMGSADTLTGLLIGGNSYAVEETGIPAGYTKAPDFTITMGTDGKLTLGGAPVGVKLAEDRTGVVVSDSKTAVKLTKSSAAGTDGIATFTVEGALANDSTSMSITTAAAGAAAGADGEYSFEGVLKVGEEYAITETVPPAGCTVVAPFKVKVAADGTVSAEGDVPQGVTVSGTSITIADAANSLTFVKTGAENAADGTAKALDGAEFKVTGAFADGSKEQVVSGNGDALVGKLVAGSEYEVTETKVPAGYTKVPAGYTKVPDFKITVDVDGKVSLAATATGVSADGSTVTVSDEQNALSVAKTGVGEQSLAGTSFELSPVGQATFADGSKNSLTWAIAEDDPTNNPYAITGRLVAGSAYKLTETTPAPGYTVAADVYLKMDDAGKLQQAASANGAFADVAGNKVNVADDLNTFTLNKLGVEANAGENAVTAALKGAIFTVSAENGKSFADGSTKKDVLNGNAFQELKGQMVAGTTYSFTETTVPSGYIKVADFKLEMGNDGKVESVDALPQGVVIYDGSEAAERGAFVAVNNMKNTLSFTKNELYVEECSDTELDAPSPDSVRPLAGAEFTLFTDEGCTAKIEGQTATSNENGTVTFTGVPISCYMKETVTPQGHKVNDTVYAVQVNVDGEATRLSPVGEEASVLQTITNDVVRGTISIKKVAETNPDKTLPNSTYGLYKKASATQQPESAEASETSLLQAFGFMPAVAYADDVSVGDWQLIAKATTDKDGMLTFPGVLLGTDYMVKELVAPDGSLVSENPISITFKEDAKGNAIIESFDDGSGTAQVVDGEIVWSEPQVQVYFAKKNPEGELIAGATLRVEDEQGNLVGQEWTSSATEPHLIEGVLVAGKTYKLVETAAPDGYLLADPVSVTIKNPPTGPNVEHAQSVEMVDQRKPASITPSTACRTPKTGDNPYSSMLLGVTALSATVLGASFVHGRRRKQQR